MPKQRKIQRNFAATKKVSDIQRDKNVKAADKYENSAIICLCKLKIQTSAKPCQEAERGLRAIFQEFQ